jgi:hypothetical protein
LAHEQTTDPSFQQHYQFHPMTSGIGQAKYLSALPLKPGYLSVWYDIVGTLNIHSLFFLSYNTASSADVNLKV